MMASGIRADRLGRISEIDRDDGNACGLGGRDVRLAVANRDGAHCAAREIDGAGQMPGLTADGRVSPVSAWK